MMTFPVSHKLMFQTTNQLFFGAGNPGEVPRELGDTLWQTLTKKTMEKSTKKWVNPLFPWPLSIAMLLITRG